MKQQSRVTWGLQVVAAAAMLVIVFPSTARAYVDPGIGSFAFQVIIGGLISVAYLIREYWKRIIRMFRRRPAPDDEG